VELQMTLGCSSIFLCSAALARKLIQQQLVEDFAEKTTDHAGIVAWLGGQRGT
jgi:GTP cyclohydrolase IB